MTLTATANTTALHCVEADILSALQCTTPQDDSTIVSCMHLHTSDRKLLAEHLGKGEVIILAGADGATEITETIYPGVWHSITRSDTNEIREEHLEIGAIPRIVRTINLACSTEPASRRTVPSEGIMNAPSVLAEVMAHAKAWHTGCANHVINFTLLPMTAEDMALVIQSLGKAPLAIRTKNYGACMISSTEVRHVWTVQYYNSEGKIILNTVEVGDVPTAAQAAREDFEDSARRFADRIADI